MMPMLDTTNVRLGIEFLPTGTDCVLRHTCAEFAQPLYAQLNSGKYDVCATMPLPKTREAWEAEHRTARKRATRATARGYFAMDIKRHEWASDIEAINKSKPYRQGRPMTATYTERQSTTPDREYPCALHAVRSYGVAQLGWDNKQTLVAYLTMYRSGDLALVSQVLGHEKHEGAGVMYLLFRHALEAEGAIAPGVCVYNRWDSGTDGLRFLKARVGFEETAVEWLP